jgi:hypothetical protein
MQTDDLRSIVEALDRAISRCAAEEGALADMPALLACWAKLVDHLALMLPPDLRRCPSCGTTAARAAKFCAACCRNLDPLPPVASA